MTEELPAPPEKLDPDEMIAKALYDAMGMIRQSRMSQQPEFGWFDLYPAERAAQIEGIQQLIRGRYIKYGARTGLERRGPE